MTEWQRRVAQNLRSQLSTMGQRSLPSGRDGFDDEFDSLRVLDYKIRGAKDEFYSACLGSNLSKNRFRDVLPNEGTRVVLDAVNERGDGDYINANYVDARRIFGVPFVYIATQAPMRNTVFDFWRMVYENNAVFIVMLCNEVESGKIKSERYWPESAQESPLIIGPLSIELVNENSRSESIFRTLVLRTSDGKERVIQHLQYVRWPDQSIPQSSAGLMEIIEALGKTELSTQTPIVVHCSGGVGRTGVFITLHVGLALFQLEQPISIPRIVQLLKYCRTGMVQRKDQYLFCYYAMLREMERMIWAVDSKRQLTARMTRPPASPLNGELPLRRESEHRAKFAAQTKPPILKSSLRAVTVNDEFAAAAASRESPYSVAAPPLFGLSTSRQFTRPSTNSERRSFPSYVRPVGLEWAAAANDNADDLNQALADLKRANQQRRQTPSRYGSITRYDQPASGRRETIGPLMGNRRDDDYRPDGTKPIYPSASSPSVPVASPLREPSMDRSAVGLGMTSPDLMRYSAQPVTPSDAGNGYERSPPGISNLSAAGQQQQRPSFLPMTRREEETGAAETGTAPAAHSRPLPSVGDVEAAISDFDAAMFADVRRRDVTLI